MNLKFQIENTQAAIEAWATVEPGAVSPGLRSYREAEYSVAGPPECGSAGCFGGHLPYFAHFAELGVRASKYGTPFLKRRSNLVNNSRLVNNSLSEYLFRDPYLFYVQSDRELGTGHEAVAARLRANLERLLALERSEVDQQKENQK